MKEYKNLIEDGMLERYVLGELSKSDMEVVDRAIATSPEIKARYNQIEADLEHVARENAIQPPDHVKQGIFRQLEQDPDIKVVPIRKKKRSGTFTLVAATLAVLFLLSSFWLYQKLTGIEENRRLVKDQNAVLLDENKDLITSYDEINKWYGAVNNADTEKLIMRGNNLAPNARAVTYINHQNKTVILNAEGLPALPEDQDYQLWADVEGVMIDMGVIPKGKGMAVMHYIDKAESLNITIEPAGGNDHPTVSNLISNVYL